MGLRSLWLARIYRRVRGLGPRVHCMKSAWFRGSTRTLLEMPRVPQDPPVHLRKETIHNSLCQVRLKAGISDIFETCTCKG